MKKSKGVGIDISNKIRTSESWQCFFMAIAKKILLDNDKRSLRKELLNDLTENSLIKYAGKKLITQKIVADFEDKNDEHILLSIKDSKERLELEFLGDSQLEAAINLFLFWINAHITWEVKYSLRHAK